MAKLGRNEACPCGSGREAKRCCGIPRGPSEEQLARAALAALRDEASFELAGLDEADTSELWYALDDLPTVDLSLHARLPDLVTPERERLAEALAEDGPDPDALAAVAASVDTPCERRRLAEAVLALGNGDGSTATGRPRRSSTWHARRRGSSRRASSRRSRSPPASRRRPAA